MSVFVYLSGLLSKRDFTNNVKSVSQAGVTEVLVHRCSWAAQRGSQRTFKAYVQMSNFQSQFVKSEIQFS